MHEHRLGERGGGQASTAAAPDKVLTRTDLLLLRIRSWGRVVSLCHVLALQNAGLYAWSPQAGHQGLFTQWFIALRQFANTNDSVIFILLVCPSTNAPPTHHPHVSSWYSKTLCRVDETNLLNEPCLISAKAILHRFGHMNISCRPFQYSTDTW